MVRLYLFLILTHALLQPVSIDLQRLLYKPLEVFIHSRACHELLFTGTLPNVQLGCHRRPRNIYKCLYGSCKSRIK